MYTSGQEDAQDAVEEQQPTQACGAALCGSSS